MYGSLKDEHYCYICMIIDRFEYKNGKLVCPRCKKEQGTLREDQKDKE